MGAEVITDRPGRFVAILVATEDLVLTVTRFAAGEPGAPPHVHHEHTDTFVVVRGRLTVPLTGGQELVAGPGTAVCIPPGVVHGFRNDGPEELEVLNAHTPGAGFDRYLRGEHPGFDQHEPPADGGLPPSLITLARA